MYAIIETGGKQLRIAEGDVIVVEKLPAEPGSEVRFDNVLLVEKDGAVTVGTPTVKGAAALGRVLEQGKGKKILVFRYKAKKNVRRRRGHRQPFTRVRIEKIEA